MEKSVRAIKGYPNSFAMNTSLKTIILVIGILSIAAGVFSYVRDNVSNAYLGIFIGIVLIGSALLFKPKQRD